MAEHATDDLGSMLVRLAPDVDLPASRSVFERERAASSAGVGAAGRRWLAAAAVLVLAAGVVGVWALARDGDGTMPLDPPATTAPPMPDGPLTEGNGYDTLLVAETNSGFGLAFLAGDRAAYDEWWEILLLDGEAPAIDFDEAVALMMTRPDNACADTIVRFDLETTDPAPVWAPVFEDLSNGCDDPLLSWAYVVAVDRSALGSGATIRIPAAEIYGVNETLLTYEGPGLRSADATDDGSSDQVIEATGVTVPLPEVGSPRLVSAGQWLVWVVAHGDGSVSVLPATVAVEGDGDGDAGSFAPPLHALVRRSMSGRTFTIGSLTWDDRGRTISGGRTNDLGRLVGRIVENGEAGDSPAVEILVVIDGSTRVDGAPNPPFGGEEYPVPDLGRPIDLATWMTFSSTGPTWRHFDATLVVEDGVGRICDIQPDPVPELATCTDLESAGELVLDTQIRGDAPDITTWFHSPILAFQDPVRGFTTIVPLGGQSSRNEVPFDVDVAPDEIEVLIDEVVPGCTIDAPPLVRLLVGWPVLLSIRAADEAGSQGVTTYEAGPEPEQRVTLELARDVVGTLTITVAAADQPDVVYDDASLSCP